MSKEEKQVMVINNKELFKDNYFEGFIPAESVPFTERIIEKYIFMKRKFAETDTEHKQPIAYAVIVNPSLKQIFAFKRADKKAAYFENRLHGRWTIGTGGHIEPEDTENAESDPIYFSLLRELNEEVVIEGCAKPRLLGYINYDAEEVCKYHFGLLYIVETDATSVKPAEPEIEIGRLMDIEELEKIINTEGVILETWSKIALIPIKKYLERCKNG